MSKDIETALSREKNNHGIEPEPWFRATFFRNVVHNKFGVERPQLGLALQQHEKRAAARKSRSYVSKVRQSDQKPRGRKADTALQIRTHLNGREERNPLR